MEVTPLRLVLTLTSSMTLFPKKSQWLLRGRSLSRGRAPSPSPAGQFPSVGARLSRALPPTRAGLPLAASGPQQPPAWAAGERDRPHAGVLPKWGVSPVSRVPCLSGNVPRGPGAPHAQLGHLHSSSNTQRHADAERGADGDSPLRPSLLCCGAALPDPQPEPS